MSGEVAAEAAAAKKPRDKASLSGVDKKTFMYTVLLAIALTIASGVTTAGQQPHTAIAIVSRLFCAFFFTAAGVGHFTVCINAGGWGGGAGGWCVVC